MDEYVAINLTQNYGVWGVVNMREWERFQLDKFPFVTIVVWSTEAEALEHAEQMNRERTDA